MIDALGTSTPTSITVVATSTSHVAAGECAHRRCLVVGLHPAVDQADRELALVGRGQLRMQRHRGLQLELFRLLDQRAHPIGLTPLGAKPAEPIRRSRRGASGWRVASRPACAPAASRRASRRRGRRRTSSRACAGSASRSSSADALPRVPCREARAAGRRRSDAARRRSPGRAAASRRLPGTARACRPRTAPRRSPAAARAARRAFAGNEPDNHASSAPRPSSHAASLR